MYLEIQALPQHRVCRLQMYFCQPQPERKILKPSKSFSAFRWNKMVWWDISINIKSLHKSLIPGWSVFCVEGSEVQCNDYRPAPGYRPPSGHPGHHNYPNIRIIHKLCSASPAPPRWSGGLSLVIRPSSEIYWKFIHLFQFSTWSWICQETNKVHLFCIRGQTI